MSDQNLGREKLGKGQTPNIPVPEKGVLKEKLIDQFIKDLEPKLLNIVGRWTIENVILPYIRQNPDSWINNKTIIVEISKTKMTIKGRVLSNIYYNQMERVLIQQVQSSLNLEKPNSIMDKLEQLTEEEKEIILISIELKHPGTNNQICKISGAKPETVISAFGKMGMSIEEDNWEQIDSGLSLFDDLYIKTNYEYNRSLINKKIADYFLKTF